MISAPRTLTIVLLALWTVLPAARAQHGEERQPMERGGSRSADRVCLTRVQNQSARVLNMGLARRRLSRHLEGAGWRAVELESSREADVEAEARERKCRYLLAAEVQQVFDSGERTPAGGPLPDLDRRPGMPPRLEHTVRARFHLSEVGATGALAARAVAARQYGREELAVERAMDEVARRVLRELNRRRKTPPRQPAPGQP